jgi:hypothetical protein
MLRIYPHWGFEKSIPELLYCWQPHKYWVILPTIQRLPILGLALGDNLPSHWQLPKSPELPLMIRRRGFALGSSIGVV